MTEASKLGEFLRQLREDRGLSIRTAAEMLHVSPASIVRWESGTVPQIGMRLKLATFYDIPVAELNALAREEASDGDIRDDGQERRSD